MLSLSDTIHAENNYSSLGSHFSKHCSMWIVPPFHIYVLWGPLLAAYTGQVFAWRRLCHCPDPQQLRMRHVEMRAGKI